MGYVTSNSADSGINNRTWRFKCQTWFKTKNIGFNQWMIMRGSRVVWLLWGRYPTLWQFLCGQWWLNKYQILGCPISLHFWGLTSETWGMTGAEGCLDAFPTSICSMAISKTQIGSTYHIRGLYTWVKEIYDIQYPQIQHMALIGFTCCNISTVLTWQLIGQHLMEAWRHTKSRKTRIYPMPYGLIYVDIHRIPSRYPNFVVLHLCKYP